MLDADEEVLDTNLVLASNDQFVVALLQRNIIIIAFVTLRSISYGFDSGDVSSNAGVVLADADAFLLDEADASLRQSDLSLDGSQLVEVGIQISADASASL